MMINIWRRVRPNRQLGDYNYLQRTSWYVFPLTGAVFRHRVAQNIKPLSRIVIKLY